MAATHDACLRNYTILKRVVHCLEQLMTPDDDIALQKRVIKFYVAMISKPAKAHAF